MISPVCKNKILLLGAAIALVACGSDSESITSSSNRNVPDAPTYTAEDTQPQKSDGKKETVKTDPTKSENSKTDETPADKSVIYFPSEKKVIIALPQQWRLLRNRRKPLVFPE